ncbi:sigma-54-dependent Fis family transcriptional regulator [Agrobacterium larrymoorei]|nr:sigma-54-dependent Fis family transcriptional regulator [Agrobacterium larrymoorei]QYA10113.1 sigma-54-dependent Fis family transcriptional regulator [Agrobacterium larrymoorei]
MSDTSATASWRRCVEVHNLDPCNFRSLPIMGHRELNLERERLEDALLLAKEELDGLYLAVKSIGYSTSLANKDGVLIVDSADHDSANWCEFDRPGSVWTEAYGGTNGVGTCIATGEFTTVFQNEHFFSDLSPTACVAAPLYGPSCEFWGVLNLSIKREMLQEETHKLAASITRQYARRLSARLFKNKFRETSIFQFREDGGDIGLLALGEDQLLLGANAAARKLLNINEREINSSTIWRFVERDTALFKSGGRSRDVSLRLRDRPTLVTGNISFASRVTTSKASSISKARTPLRTLPGSSVTLEDWAGGDAKMQRSAQLAERILSAGLPVLILGETGTGKDTLARALHQASPRSSGPFVAFNCAAVPETLIDSELFGYTSGAFTGANREGNQGRVLEAHGGTLFLDEIGDMPISLQTRLLRLLETREVVPLGSGKATQVDIHVIAATNQNLEQAIAKKHFREDLYYRLAGAVIDIPALRDRNDVGQIIDRLLVRLTPGQIELAPNARRLLLEHRWPGNIRELVNVLRRAAAVASEGLITADDLMLRAAYHNADTHDPIPTARSASPAGPKACSNQRERELLLTALSEYPRDVEAAASSLGMSRATIYRKISKHAIDLKTIYS